ncbi:MAG: hypothetical protein HC799_05215 [Limnothrix sp. RL_2_0]|nr:hypothetical protein [Limnothrix sp. RL_2_0]
MFKRKIVRLISNERTFATIFLIILSIFIVSHNLEKPRLLFVHSYERDYSWTTEQIDGINRILEGKNNYIIREHFLDTKKKDYDEYLKRSEREVRALIKQWKPNVIIATDDNAQILAGKYFVDDPKIKIVFTGVQGDLSEYYYASADNVTGITEHVPPQAIKETLNEINRSLDLDLKRIFFVTHSTSHSRFVVENMQNFAWGDYEMVSAAEYKTFEDWKAAVREAEETADILLIGGYKSLDYEDSSLKVPYEEVLRWTDENSSLLKIGARGVYVEDGGMIAVGVSPYEQGEVAAKMAIALLENHKKIEDLPVQKSQQYLIYMRQSKMDEYSPFLKMPTVYEAFARATNHYFD